MTKTEKLNQDVENTIKKLGRTIEAQKELSEQLAKISEKRAELEATLGETLESGVYTTDDWVCKVFNQISKGRSSPSWKKISESIASGIDVIGEDLTKRFPEAEQVISKMSKRLHKRYEEAVETNTTVSPDKETTVINVERVSVNL